MLTGERLLIIEEEFLIALDIQRVIEDAHASEPVFARNFAEAAQLTNGFQNLDLAIVNTPRRAEQQIAEQLTAAGPAIVVCSAMMGGGAGAPMPGAETVSKPFLDADLLAACRRAIDKRKARH